MKLTKREDLEIHDHVSSRGLLVMTGIDPKTSAGNRIYKSKDEGAVVWLGAIDDLWDLGKPIGEGGPWKNTKVVADEPSDPYLICFYNKKKLEISHDSDSSVEFHIEVESMGHGRWLLYEKIFVNSGEVYTHRFPENFRASWIRFKSGKDCKVTAWLTYY